MRETAAPMYGWGKDSIVEMRGHSQRPRKNQETSKRAHGWNGRFFFFFFQESEAGGREAPKLKRFRGTGLGEQYWQEPPVMSEPRDQCGLWYANRHHSQQFVLSFLGTWRYFWDSILMLVGLYHPCDTLSKDRALPSSCSLLLYL